MHFIEHGFAIRSRIISAKQSIETCFIYDGIEDAILTLETTRIHLLISQLRNLFFVVLLHLFNHGERYVYVCYMLIAILKHILRHF